MKIRELIEMLSKMDQEMEVRVTDTFWMEEGYGEHAHDPAYLTTPLGTVVEDEVNGKKVCVLDCSEVY